MYGKNWLRQRGHWVSTFPRWSFNLSSNGDTCESERRCYYNNTGTTGENCNCPSKLGPIGSLGQIGTYSYQKPLKSLLHLFCLGPDFCSGAVRTLHSFRSFTYPLIQQNKFRSSGKCKGGSTYQDPVHATSSGGTQSSMGKTGSDITLGLLWFRDDGSVSGGGL